MRCPRCGNDIKEGWEYCPRCGNVLRKRDMFDDIFRRMRKEMAEMDRVFEKDMQFFDISPFFRQRPRGSGFTIKISRSGNNEPKVSVKTFGNVDNGMRKEISQELKGMGIPGEPRKEEEKRSLVKRLVPAGRGPVNEAPKRESPRKEICEPKVTEEPQCEVRPLGDRVAVEIRLPDVKSENDIRINELESSVEVKAMVKDKAYFKILTKPGNTRITKKSFSKGILHMEFQ